MFKPKKDQEAAIFSTGKDVVVSASAGAGKTTVLIEYLFRQIGKNHVPVNNILAMTFTKAAAQNMKKKLFQRMAIKLTEEEIKENYDEAFINQQRKLLPSADICTIDSFCTKILQNESHLLGWDPQRVNTIIEGNALSQLKRDVSHYVVEQESDINNKAFIKLCGVYNSNGNHTDELEETIIKLSTNINDLRNPTEWRQKVNDYYHVRKSDEISDEYKDIIAQAIKRNIDYYLFLIDQFLEDTKSNPDYLVVYDKYFEIKKHLKELLDNLDKHLDIEELQSIEKTPTPSTFFNKKTSEHSISDVMSALNKKVGDVIDKIKKIILEYESIGIQNENLEDVVNCLLSLVDKYQIELQKEKERLNVIDYSDMSFYALKLLREHPSLAEKYRNIYRLILVDEYQDSNDIQEMIVSLIARDNPYNVYRVGDVKQSIYRFRGAVPSLMRNLIRSNDQRYDKVVFKHNFRSTETIINWNNEVYKKLMNIDGFNDTYTSDNDVVEAGMDQQKLNDDKVEIDLLNFEEYKNPETNRPSKEIESIYQANYIAEKIKLMHDTSKYNKWKDYVVLVRNHDSKNYLRNAFEANNIKYFFVTNEGYYIDDAITTVISWLKIINNYNKISLVSVLTSPYYMVTNEILAKWKIEKGDKYLSHDELTKEGLSFEEDYKKLKSVERKEGILGLLKEIFYLKDFYYQYTTQEQRDNLDYLYENAISLYQEDGNLNDFINWIEMNQQADHGNATSVSENEDVVRVVTIHASKGLEYPVVFYLTNKLCRNTKRRKYYLDEELGFSIEAVKMPYRFHFNPLISELIKDKDQRDSIEEEIRMMYVATTRAKEKLVIVGFEKENEKVNFISNELQSISDNDYAIGNILRDCVCGNKDMNPDWFEVNYIKRSDIAMNYQKSKTDNQKYQRELYTQKVKTYNEFSPSDLEEKDIYPISYVPATNYALVGTILHKAFEDLDFKNPRIEDIVLPISEEDKEKIMAFFDHPIGKKIQTMDIYKELPYALQEEDNFIHGYMDLVAISDDEIILVDYKSDRGVSGDELVERYRDQQLTYKKALSYLNKKITCYLYSLEHRDMFEVKS